MLYLVEFLEGSFDVMNQTLHTRNLLKSVMTLLKLLLNIRGGHGSKIKTVPIASTS